jgi:predicted O-methyltransferase YrrM
MITNYLKRFIRIANVIPGIIPTLLRFTTRGNLGAWAIYTHMNPLERLLLYRLGLRHSPGARFLEVGSFLGASACFLAAAAQEIGGGTMVHCVDTWSNDAMAEGQRDTWNEFKKNTAPYSSVIISQRGHSVEIGRKFTEPLDLLFIDGDHSYEGCRADVLTWMPHLKPGGTLIMHDYTPSCGVPQVVAELIQPHQKNPGHIFLNTYWTIL